MGLVQGMLLPCMKKIQAWQLILRLITIQELSIKCAGHFVGAKVCMLEHRCIFVIHEVKQESLNESIKGQDCTIQ